MKMRMKLLMAAVAVMVTMGAKAQGYGPGPRGPYGVPGPHPAYMRALSDLRGARHYLADNWSWGGVRADDDAAIREIDAAIREIKMASIDDGHGPNDPFPMDRRFGPRDRFGKANELLNAAMHDLDHAEDVPSSRGLRNRAMMHISQAHQIVDAAWRNAHARWQ